VITYDDITQLDNELVAEACEDAADLLEGHWVQGEWYITDSYIDEQTGDETENWGYCLEGGLAAALGLDICDMEDTNRLEMINCPVYTAVLETINQQAHQELLDRGFSGEYQPSYGEGDLPNWNDRDGRTEQEVVDLLRATAKRVLTDE
jgi:hypothetical protein